MSAIILHRTDPVKNMRRFYRLDVQPDLFGQWCFIKISPDRSCAGHPAHYDHTRIESHRNVQQKAGPG